MARDLVTCQRCKARKFEGEVIYNKEIKDYVCRDEVKCSKAGKQIGKRKGKQIYANTTR